MRSSAEGPSGCENREILHNPVTGFCDAGLNLQEEPFFGIDKGSVTVLALHNEVLLSLNESPF